MNGRNVPLVLPHHTRKRKQEESRHPPGWVEAAVSEVFPPGLLPRTPTSLSRPLRNTKMFRCTANTKLITHAGKENTEAFRRLE
ncbi:hypothetical protein E2C01_006922 [Portunus trituberculatus]|uniref:Uncharacterized protein n=1 Tax=Portunus trituberculatus TaxID=210409 RepID=A0A5B7CYM0_PORTR|nr:hypothetical protein [Portunus trituberculatus]